MFELTKKVFIALSFSGLSLVWLMSLTIQNVYL